MLDEWSAAYRAGLYTRNMGKRNFWFKRRRYGYGWIPVTWQGWSVIAGYLGVVVASMYIVRDVPENSYDWRVGLYTLILVLATSGLILISYRKGPKPKWRWGSKPTDDPEEDW